MSDAIKWRDLTPEMQLALTRIARGRSTPDLVDASVATFRALERRKLIHVDTTFDAVAFPRSSAWAKITQVGIDLLAGKPSEDR